MPTPVEIHSQIAELLANLPIFAQEDGRRAVLVRTGLDETLMAQIDVRGAPFVFLTNLVDILAEYGQLASGQDALQVFLGTTGDLVGSDKREALGKLIAEWRSIRKTEKQAWPAQIEIYLKHLIHKWNTTDSPLLPSECRLSEVAAPLRAVNTGIKAGETTKTRPAGYKGAFSPIDNTAELHEFFRYMPEEERWILLGDPGTGKTTLLLYTAAQLARGALNDPTASIPIWVTLAPFGQQLERVPGYSLYEHIDSVGRSLLLSEFGREVQRVARKGKVIFLLDGLDEVLDHVREHLEDAIEVVLAIGTGNRVVITSRKVGFSGFLGYPLLEIAPLSLDDQRRIMLAICGKQKTQRLLAEISGRQELQDMASVPMMLTVLALVAREADHFSVDFFRRHSDLFRLASRILLEGRHRNRRGVAHPYHAELVLAHTSLVLHGNMDRARGDEVFDANDVEQAVATADQNWLTPWQGPRHFVEDVATTSNIIYPIDTLAQRYRYLHRTFREFLVALELSRWDSGRRREFVESVLDKQSYAEILVLLGGLVPDVDDYLTFLLSGPPDLALRSLKEVDSLDPKLAARVLQLRPMRLQARKQVFVELVRKLPSTDHLVDVLWAYLESAKETIPRVDLYFIQETLRNCNTPLADDLLGEMFKYLPSVPRDLFDYTDVMGEKLPYWSSVPEGKCVIGAAADDPEKPDWVATATEVYISSFDIGCVPVTNRVYEIFDPAHRRIRDFQDRVPPEDLDHHPVVRISWYEAEMFCHWAAQIFADVRLPTEFEWEKAASWTGERKLRFPWGDDWDPTFLNSWERGPNMTTRVGAYPQGVSPCGALDMAGNVWEWCLDWFRDDVEAYFTSLQSNPQDPIGPPSGVRRVDRGGGWYHDVGVPCTFLRAADDPADIFSHCGFRVVRSPVTQGRGSDLFGGQSTLKRIQIQEDEPTGVLEKIMALLSEHQKPES